MFDATGDGDGVLGVSTPVGVTLMVVVVVLLASLVVVTTTDLARSTQESSRVHGIGTFDVQFQESGNDSLRISPDTLRNEDSTYILEVNDNRVYRWDGHEPLEFTCLYPGDHIEIISEEGETTYPVREYRMERGLSCERIRPLPEKFEYAYIENQTGLEKVRVQPDFTFGIEIDPDGPDDDDFDDSYASDVGKIPVTNQFHYIRKYDKSIEGVSPPVWVIVMTDNVHKTGNAGGLNWTDDPDKAYGKDAYNVESTGGGNEIEPITGDSTEPTNDIYMVFEPGCSGSRLKIIDVVAGYNNRIYINGQVAVPDTYAYSEYNASRTEPPVELDAPAVNCPSNP